MVYVKNKNKRQPPPPPASSSSDDDHDDDEDRPVDYGAAADAYAADHSDHNIEEEEEETSLEHHAEEAEEAEEEDDDEEDEEEDDDMEANTRNEEAAADDDDEEDEEEDASEEEVEGNDADSHQEALITTTTTGGDSCWLDLRNLTAVHSHPLEESALYRKNAKTKMNSNNSDNTTKNCTTIDGLATANTPDESYLLQHASAACTQLIAALWDLPTERSDAGPLVTLPTYDALVLPRALPPPPPKTETKWERFAKERGINVNQEKRSRKVWDETTGEWKYRTGKDSRAKAQSGLDWPILEVKPGQDPMADPWERLREEKFQRLEKNRGNQLANQERAGDLPKGTTRRLVKARSQARQAGKEGGGTTTRVSEYNDQAVPMAAPAGVPVDMAANKGTLRGKTSTVAALKATQVSTASLGKFDRMRQGEPARPTQKGKEKRKAAAGTENEAERSAKVLKTVLAGDGGVAKEKARKAGKLAHGATAYDYEYDDGSNHAFKKKKGRAGIGKNRKMTKKRIK